MTGEVDWSGLTQFRFGDSPELADRLASLVIAGVKTATCSAASHGLETSVGEQQVVLSGEGQPVGIIQTLSLDVLPFEQVTPEQAALEGEGDLSHAYWYDAHKAYFEREGTYTPDMAVIFETFRLVDTLDASFAARADEHLKAERAEARAAGYTAAGAVS
ncbi:ASCH domain-containing protein [Hyphomonas oceanitis]|uniref:ASCH domain-containing protein n=1 Tax=Hyphomonas oceanitis TaxID=81033 RepID=UPI00300301C2